MVSLSFSHLFSLLCSFSLLISSFFYDFLAFSFSFLSETSFYPLMGFRGGGQKTLKSAPGQKITKTSTKQV